MRAREILAAPVSIPAEIYHGTGRESLISMFEGDMLMVNDDDTGMMGVFCSGDLRVAQNYIEAFTPYEGPDGGVIVLDTQKLLAAGISVTPYTYHSGDDGQEFVIHNNEQDIHGLKQFVRRIVFMPEDTFDGMEEFFRGIPITVEGVNEHSREDRRAYHDEMMPHLPEKLTEPEFRPEFSSWPPSEMELRQAEKQIFQDPEWLAYYARFDWTSFHEVERSGYFHDRYYGYTVFRDVPSLFYVRGEVMPDRTNVYLNNKGEVVPSPYFKGETDKYAHLHVTLPSALDLCRAKVRQIAAKTDWMKGTYYIRFGDWPENERSRNWLVKDREVYEAGVSVYHANYDTEDDRWEIEASVNYETIAGTMQSLIYGNKPVYLVQGDELDQEGADGEPLLRNVRKIKLIDKMDVCLPGVFDPREDL